MDFMDLRNMVQTSKRMHRLGYPEADHNKGGATVAQVDLAIALKYVATYSAILQGTFQEAKFLVWIIWTVVKE